MNNTTTTTAWDVWVQYRKDWVHLYTEAHTEEEARRLGETYARQRGIGTAAFLVEKRKPHEPRLTSVCVLDSSAIDIARRSCRP